MNKLYFGIILLLIFSLNSCKFAKDVLEYEYLKKFNNKINESIESINKKMSYIESLIKINESSIEQLKQDVIKLEEKNEKD
jgi:hypothetical protein